MQTFQNARKRTKESRTLAMRLRRVWSKVAAHEELLMRRQAMLDKPSHEATDAIDRETGHCSCCNKVHFATTGFGEGLQYAPECPVKAAEQFETKLIYFEGRDGRCTNSPFGGHDRWVGNKLGNILAKILLLMSTPERNTSTMCSCCSHRLRKARRPIVKNGKIVMVTVNGMLECRNPNCPKVKSGRGISKRDAESGVFYMQSIIDYKPWTWSSRERRLCSRATIICPISRFKTCASMDKRRTPVKYWID